MSYGIIGVLAAILIVYLLAKRKERKIKADTSLIQDFIDENPDRVSILITRNDVTAIEHDSEKIMPIAGVFQIIIAIEYAERVASGNLNPDEVIYFDQLDHFFIPKTDGGAHMAWFKSVSKRLVDGGVPLKEVVKGMLVYNSNANTEWLCDKMGLSNINKRIEILGLAQHSKINYPVSSLFIGFELFPGLEGEDLQIVLRNLSEKEYASAAHEIHQKLINDLDYKSDLKEVDFGIQKVWSDRQALSSSKNYHLIMNRLNSKRYFTSEVQGILDSLLETMMDEPSSKKWLEHAGEKTGSTAFALSKVMYATDLEGNKTEMAYFFNDLTLQENGKLLRAIRPFELQFLMT
jgi:D-alanyl-D-alanine carboxypeptidase